MSKVVIGILDTQDHAQTLLSNLERAGVESPQISLVFPDKRGGIEITHEAGNKAPEGAVVGASAGGLLGGAFGLLAGLGSIVIPGLGPLLVAGPIVAALSSAAVGAAALGVAGALVGVGVPEIEAKAYEGRLANGNILVAVHSETHPEQVMIEELMRRAGAHDVFAAPEKTPPQAQRSHRA